MAAARRPLRVSILGAGKVGTALAILFHRQKFRIVSVISRRRRDARRCARLAGCHLHSTHIEDLARDTELLVIAMRDEQILPIAHTVSARARLDFRQLSVFHTSGCLTSDELRPLRRKGALTFALHPIQSFPRKSSIDRQVQSMKGISYGVEGPRRGISLGAYLVRKLGGRIFVVPKKEKILYHLACVFASNFPVVLSGAVEELVAHFVRPPRLRHFEPLIKTSIANALRHSPRRALTGPIARGSDKVVAAHIRALRRRSSLRAMYRALGMYAVRMSARSGGLTRQHERALKEILSKA